MPITDAGANAMLDHWASLATHASLHDGFPGATGANELTGGAPAYARKAMTWNAAAARNLDSLATPEFDVPAGTEVQWAGFFNALTVGQFQGYLPLGGSPLGFSVDTTGNVITARGVGSEDAAHGLVNDDRVVFFRGTPPAPLVEGTLYFVVGATATTLQVAATQGGAAIDLTTVGAPECIMSKIVPESFGAQGTLTVNDADMSMEG